MHEHRVLDRWESYLAGSTSYGTYEDRVPEYRLAMDTLLRLGLRDGDLIVDVGAGSCDLDRYLREASWRGRYVPIDGATLGFDLDRWRPTVPADWFVCLETLEHLSEPDRMVRAMRHEARRGVLVTTPNADSHDVLATDPTHVSPMCRADLEALGLEVSYAVLNPQHGPHDTLVGVWTS